MKLDNTTIREAVKLWDNDNKTCINVYGHISNWDTSEVTDMSSLFHQNSNFNDDISLWNVSNVTNMRKMFAYIETFDQSIGSWDVSNVTDMYMMFYDANLFNQDISLWNVSNVNNMGGMFNNATSFNQSIGNWDLINVTNTENMFANASSFNQPIGLWNVSNVITMKCMFANASSFNQFIGSWNVSNVTNMLMMFYDAAAFDQNIGVWNVSKVSNMHMMFHGATSFNQPIGNWDVSNVTDMFVMFSNANSFNQPIGSWDVRNVTTMNSMFSNANSFNQPIGSWDIRNVIAMDNMFAYATSFNQDIRNWKVSKDINISYMFQGASSFNPEYKPTQAFSNNSDDNMNDLKEVLFSLQLEGTYYYQDEENEADYFIAYQLIVIVSDEYSDDAEFEIYECLQIALNDENLIFTDVGENSETYRIIGLPEIEFFEFENGNFTLLDNTNIVDAIEFLKNMKTINFNSLKSSRPDDIKNYKWVESNEVEKTDSNKTQIEKNTKFIDDFQRTSKVISKLDEEEALKHLVIGISKYEIENYEGALDDYKKSIELNPNNARTYLEIGNAKLKLNDYKGAILDYSKSIELDSNHADTYHNRSIAKSKLADCQGVIDDCTKTIEIDNNYAKAYFNRGVFNFYLKEFQETINDMNKFIELNPNDSIAYNYRGNCMYEFEQHESALKDLNKAMELDPNSTAYITIDKIKEKKLNIEAESTNKIVNTVETNYQFKNIIDSFIKKEKVKNFELTINITKWYGYTPYKYIGKFDGYNFRANISHVCKWGECEHNYEDINELLNDIKDYEIEELHKYLDIEIIPEDDGFELGNIKWEEGTPDEFIEKMKEEWDVFDIMDNGYEEEIFDIIYKEGAIIDGIRVLLSNDDSTFEISWEYSKV